MSSRPNIKPKSVITNGNMSGNLTSIVSVLTNISMVSYAISWAGSSPSGSMSVQVSNDYTQNEDGSVANAGTWNTLTLSAPTTVSGNTGNGFIDVTATAAYAIRLVYTFVSGTGTMQATVIAKVA